jgi:hypothetical protein
MQFALLAIAILALCASAVAVRSYRRIEVLREENERRNREVAAYKSLSIEPESYGVPDAVVDQCRPVRVAVGDTFILVGMLTAEKLMAFTRAYAIFLAKYRQYADAMTYLLTGTDSTGKYAESLRTMLCDPLARTMLVEIIDQAVLSNVVANPNGVTAEDIATKLDPDHLMRIMHALWQYNLGDHFKKKLQIQTLLIQQVMEWDLSGLPSSASPRMNTAASLSPGLPFFQKLHPNELN